jgi:ADP-heptose:LPS heptosyltransferase
VSNHRTDCRFFTGYRPCRYGGQCVGCDKHRPIELDILLINLDALGDVLRTTALLPAIRRQAPNARITWLTRPRALPLLEGNPDVDRVLSLGVEADILLRSLTFDVVLNADKSMTAGALAMQVNARERRGFGIDPTGAIIPLNSSAQHLYNMGLDDALKFHGNQRTAPDLLAEALGFEHRRDGYVLKLEHSEVGPPRRVGFNTGCGPKWPLKKLSLDVTEASVRQIAAITGEPILLLGGPEDRDDHRSLAQRLGSLVERTPLDRGLRHGAAQVDRCDVVVTGDSLGMHMAIALDKHVVAWFGPTSPQEIDLYDRGVKVLADVQCAPCWKPACPETIPCRERVRPDWISRAVTDCLTHRDAGVLIDEVRGANWAAPA